MSNVLPEIRYPAELPVSQKRHEIAEAIAANQVVIVAGETGSGKTTQLPKICLELGRTSIGHTQPRRIAARTIAERIAEELGVELGELVGYQVRFTDRATERTRIKLMTDGILLNELTHDRMLSRYDTIIIDEAHERSLNIDFLIGYLKQLLPQRPDLKLIITSATIDPASFAAHFADANGVPAPIVEVSGRTFPVEVRYRPLVADGDASDEDVDASAVTEERAARLETRPTRPSQDRDLFEGINAAIDELSGESSGDILVFLSGENEIRDAEDSIRGRNLPRTEVLPLYGRLSSDDQHKVFEPSRTAGVSRRIILATNVAETSLTVPGIKYVIDGGTARISRYSVRAKVQRLPIEAISQASANQRSGRSGRTSDGIAIRLYSETDYEKRSTFTDPEILRTSLAAVILQLVSLELGDASLDLTARISEFPFLQPPDSRGVKDGIDLLRELGALTPAGKLTKVGRDLARLPLDPRFARMVIESRTHDVSREVLVVVSGMTIQDPRERPLERRAQADEKHARFRDPTSDFVTLVNLWNYLEAQQRELSSSAFRRLCKAEFLNFLRIREWQDLYRQLVRLAKPLRLTIGDAPLSTDAEGAGTNGDAIHKSLLAGLLSQIGIKDERASAKAAPKDARGQKAVAESRGGAIYLGARQVKFAIFPGSALAKKPPVAVMSAELVETSRLFARMNAAIDPTWAEPIAGDLVKRTYGEPHWEKRQGAAVAYERATLYGVPIVERRRVQFARIDPIYARELFIRHGLIEGEWPSDTSKDRLYDFDRANRALLAELSELEERSRRRDILLDDEAVYEFYARRIPADVFSMRTFEGWWRKAKKETPDLLTLRKDDLLDEPEQASIDETAFPPTWTQGDQTLMLSYRFEPGAEDDGVTVQVPLALLAGLSPAGFDWQVPGFREELVTALIRSLPKAIRRNVVPANDWARRLLAEVPAGADLTEQPIVDYLAGRIRGVAQTPVSGDDFELERLPTHLRIAFAVVDERGNILARSTDLPALQHKLRTRARDSVARVFRSPAVATKPAPGRPTSTAAAPAGIERAGITSWDFEELPHLVDVRQGGTVIRAYPALVDDGSTVSIRLMGTPADQKAAMRGGLRRMLQLSVPTPVGYVQDHLTGAEKVSLATSPYPSTKALFEDALAACIDDALLTASADGLFWTRTAFEAARDSVSSSIVDQLFGTVSLIARILTKLRDADRALKQTSSLALIGALADARAQIAGLVYPGFVSATGLTQLRRLPVYLSAVEYRVNKLAENPGRDRVGLNEIELAIERFREAGGTIPLARDADPRLIRARWLLEELRVSLFAQQLGTAEPVSLQRITRALT